MDTTQSKLHGHLTADTAKHLQDLLQAKGYEVLYEHGVDGLVSWFDNGKKPERETELGHLDIAIKEANSNKAVLLIEIEEAGDRPKAIFGDIFSTLAGDHINFKEQSLQVGVWTTLLVIAFTKTPNARRNSAILSRVQRARSVLGSKNASIGKVVIKTYADEDKLPVVVLYEVDRVLKER